MIQGNNSNLITEPVGYIFKITNLISNKIYIGKTQPPFFQNFTTTLAVESITSFKLGKDFKLLGIENFVVECLDSYYGVSVKQVKYQLPKLERHYILKFNSTENSIGYNSILDGFS